MKAASCMLSAGGSASHAPLKASALAHKNPATVSQEVEEVGEAAQSQHHGGNVNIESTVTVEPTPAATSERFSTLEAPQLASCVGEALRADMVQESPGLRRPGNSLGSAHVAKLAFPRYGDQTVAHRLVIPLAAEGQNLSVYYDYVLVRKGRADAMLTFGRVDLPVSAAMERRLAALTARRLQG